MSDMTQRLIHFIQQEEINTASRLVFQSPIQLIEELLRQPQTTTLFKESPLWFL